MLEYMCDKGYPITERALGGACEQCSLSTCFSGTGGAELAAEGNALCLESCLGRQGLAKSAVWACELDEECQRELLLLPHPPTCIFKD
eukprot:8268588-Pyramimonas_sp.AAC.1